MVLKHVVLTCLLLPELWAREEAGDRPLSRSKRQQQPRFQNFPARAQTVDRFNSDRFQTSFPSQTPQQQFVPPQQQQQQQFGQQSRQPQQQQQQQGTLPLPGSGKSLFDSIVNRINTGHRENARRKQPDQGSASPGRQDPSASSSSGFSAPLTSSSGFPAVEPPAPPAPVQVARPQASSTAESDRRQNLGLLLFGNSRTTFDQRNQIQEDELDQEREEERARQAAEQQKIAEERQRRLEENRRKLIRAQEEEKKRLQDILEQEKLRKQKEEQERIEFEERRKAELLRQQEIERQREIEKQKEEEARKQKEREELEKRLREESLRKQRIEEERRKAAAEKLIREEEARKERLRLEEKQRMEEEIRELLKEQKIIETQVTERRRLEDLRLLEIQEALRSRDQEAASIEQQFQVAKQRRDQEIAKIEKDFETAKQQRISSLRQLDEQRLRDLTELEVIENNRREAEARRQKEVLGAVDVLNHFLEDKDDVKPPQHILRALKDLSEFLEKEEQ